jgi:hypothetical protein
MGSAKYASIEEKRLILPKTSNITELAIWALTPE